MILIRKNALILFKCLCLLSLFSVADAERVFYVYKDRTGNTVMEDRVPPELMHRGYNIVNANGVTLKVVPPEKKKVKKVEKRRFDASSLSASDLLLLRSYSSVQDIETARDSRITQIHEIINSTISHALAFERNLGDMKFRHEQLTAAGELVSPKLLADIRLIEGRIAESRSYIARKESESDQLFKQYENDISRFKQLQARTRD